MKKIITALLVLALVLLVACQPMEKEAEPAPVTEPETTPEPEPEKEIMEPPKNLAPLGADIEKVCDMFVPVHRFAELCGVTEENVITTVKASDKTCWVTFSDMMNKKYTSGFTIVDWETAEEADREFDRGLSMRRLDAETDVGTRNYKYQQVGRENIVWTHGKYLTSIGASTELCSKENLLKLAQEVDGKLP